MGDETPPPLPPKLRALTGGRYSDQDIARALQEENEAYKRISREKVGRSQSQRAAPSASRENGMDGQRSRTPTDFGNTQATDSKPRPRPTTASVNKIQPIAKPRTSVNNASSSANIQSQSRPNTLSHSQATNDPKDCNKHADLMSFNSPEKPKNDILEMLHSINENRSAIVQVTNASSNPQHTFGIPQSFNLNLNTIPSSGLPPLQMYPSSIGALYPVLPIGQQQQPWANGNFQGVFGTNSTSFNSANSAFTSQQSSSAAVGLNFTSYTNSPQAVSYTAAAPPLPLRCPVTRSSLMTPQLSITGSSANPSPAVTPTTPTPSPVATSFSLDLDPLGSDLKNIGDSPASSGICNSSIASVFSCENKTSDLIDFGASHHSSASSVLDVFDPITLKVKQEEEKQKIVNETDERLSVEVREMLQIKSKSKKPKEDEMSYYELVDPFEYMQPEGSSIRSDPVYDVYEGLLSPGAVGGDTFDMPPPLPPRTSAVKDDGIDSSVECRKSLRSPKCTRRQKERKRSGIIIDGKQSLGQIQLRKIPKLSADEEAKAFWTCIKRLRGEYVWSDYIGNPGLLHSPCVEGVIDQDLSVKLKVYYMEREPIAFTACLNTGIEHVIMQCSGDLPGDCTDYILKVHGVDEYLSGATVLGEYEYVHNCIKYDQDVAFSINHTDTLPRSYQRTVEDDDAVESVQVEQLMSAGSTDIVHFDSLSIVVETFERELTRLQDSGFKLVDGTPLQDLPSPMTSRRLRQIVKQMCSLLGSLETSEVTDAISTLVDTCRTIQKAQGVLDGEDDVGGDQRMSTGSHDNHNPEEMKQWLLGSLSHLAAAVNNFLVMYTRAFRVDFTVDLTVDQTQDSKEIRDVREKVSIKVQGLHRLALNWKYDEYFIEAQLFHGSRAIGQAIHTHPKKLIADQKFYDKIIFNRWLDLGCRVNTLPRESRLVLTAYGVRIVPGDKAEEKQYIREEIGWAAIQMFSYKGLLSQGPHLLTLWPMISDRRLGPAPYSSDHPLVHSCPVLSVELAEFNGNINFPDIEPGPPNKLDFSSLDQNTQQQLLDIIERDIFTFNKTNIEEREILWEKRHYLHDKPAALAKVLLAAHSWDITCLPDLHSLVRNWSAPQPADALHLLLPSFADSVVRARAVGWIRSLGSDELVSFLPQLVQAVKHEAWDMSSSVELLLERALTSPRLAHHLYWLLNQCLPLQTNMGGEREVVSDARYTRRLHLVTRTLMAICGKNMEARLLTQELMLRSLYATALKIKDTKDAQRMSVLSHDLEDMARNLESNPTSLPLSPSLEVAGVDIRGCAYYNSFTVPLKLAFYSSEKNTDPIHAIFKVGDDLRQDMLVIQMIRLMDKLWLKEGLDLKMVTFSVVPTGDKIGIIELVKEAETLRKIQTEYGVTGSFKDRPIAEWLAKQNPSQLEYQRAVENFTKSCAGYSVATYILGICDRHNDNIMLKTSGHLFHIDFGKFLGDAQKFGNFKRDRTPFVLTSDMAYVINGGEKLSDKFQSFVDICCKAFNVIRRNGHLILYLFALMASSGIPGVTWDAVAYVERALLQDKTNAEAGAMFARMIQDSLKSWFTQVNFFIHNLAQMRFTGEQPEDTLLSFIPRTYTLSHDGRYRKIRLYNYQKRYNPNKYYVYIIKVERENQEGASYLFRSYKEFSEFHQKLCLTFPLARIHSLPKGVQIGRAEVKAVAEKRKTDLELFLKSLFDLAEEISHSDLVYTFFHPLLRDQEDTDIHIKKLKNKDIRGSVIQSSQTEAPVSLTPGHVQGQVSVSIQYLRGQLQIMVQHARNLCFLSGQQDPSPYVKLYLLPDPHKKTKRKTKVAKKTICPTFMEQITYRMSADIVKQRVLEISVWSEDMLSENIYMGSAYLKLSSINLEEEQCEWLSLEHQISTAREHIITHPT